MYKALTYINLPPNNRKAPGAKITAAELKAAGQTDQDIERLLLDGAMGSTDDDLHSDHAPIRIETNSVADVNVVTGETAEGGESP